MLNTICPSCGKTPGLKYKGVTKIFYVCEGISRTIMSQLLFKCLNCGNKILTKRVFNLRACFNKPSKKAVTNLINHLKNRSDYNIIYDKVLIKAELNGKVIYDDTGIKPKFFKEAEIRGYALIK